MERTYETISISKDVELLTPVVSNSSKHGVTLCVCGQPAKIKFCSNACRQQAHRKSAAHRARLDRLIDARSARREFHFHEKYRSRSLNDRGWTGPINDSLPSVGQLDLKPFVKRTEITSQPSNRVNFLPPTVCDPKDMTEIKCTGDEQYED